MKFVSTNGSNLASTKDTSAQLFGTCRRIVCFSSLNLIFTYIDLRQTTFLLVTQDDFQSSETMDVFTKALSRGTIPAIIHQGGIGLQRPKYLPLSESIDWKLAAVFLNSMEPKVR